VPQARHLRASAAWVLDGIMFVLGISVIGIEFKSKFPRTIGNRFLKPLSLKKLIYPET
jgi:hypothetical protein